MVPSWGRCGSSRSIAAARQAVSWDFGRQSAGIINWYQCWNNRIWRQRPDSEVRIIMPQAHLRTSESKDASNSMILVPLLNPKFATIGAARCVRTSGSRHSEPGMRSMIGSDGKAPGAARRVEGGAVTLLRDGAVKRVALAGDAAERANDALHLDRRHLLSMARTGRSGDGLVHQRAAEIVGAAAQTCFHALAAHLHPGGLDVGDQRMQREAGDRVH